MYVCSYCHFVNYFGFVFVGLFFFLFCFLVIWLLIFSVVFGLLYLCVCVCEALRISRGRGPSLAPHVPSRDHASEQMLEREMGKMQLWGEVASALGCLFTKLGFGAGVWELCSITTGAVVQLLLVSVIAPWLQALKCSEGESGIPNGGKQYTGA